jgi:CubicO group peptidase (beta-lactamase class C family)
MRKARLWMTVYLLLNTLLIGELQSQSIASQIAQVENNLAGRLILNDKPYKLQDRMRHYHVKGLSIAVINNYQMVWAKGYGWANEKEQRPVTTNTLFKPGSISKTLNALGVLKLVQEKQLSLDKDINEYLTSWKFPYDSLSKGKKINLAHLLSHTGGLSVYGGFPGYSPNDILPTIPEILDGKAPANTPAVRSLFEPGLQFQYSGGGTIISQLILTENSHQSYEKFMYNRVLKPLGMLNSFYSAAPPSKQVFNKIATGYTKNGDTVAATFRIYPEQAPLGLWTTPTELAKYLIETQLSYKGRSSKLLNQEMTRLHLTPFIDQSAAMGVFTLDKNGERYFFHDAANEGFRGMFYGSLDGGNGVIVFVNSDDGDIILELLASVANVYDWKGFDKPQNINTIQLSDSVAAKYVGSYLYDGILAEVTKKQDGLYYWTQGQDVKMYFTSEKDFVNMEFLAEKSFLTNLNGMVTGFARKVNGKEFSPAQKLVSLDTIKTNDGQLNSYAWHLIETKRFQRAIPYLQRAMVLEPQDISVQLNLAHAYLWNQDFQKAVSVYQSYLATNNMDSSLLKKNILQDFEYFEKMGFDKSTMEKLILALKLKS